MSILSILIWNLLVPGSLAALAIVLARRLARAGGPGRWGVALGLGLGFFAGYWGILGRPPTPDRDPVAWLALAAAALGAIEAARPGSARTTWVVRALFVGGLLSLVLRSKLANDWGPGESSARLAGLGAVLLASWWNLEAQAERIPGPGWMFHLALVSAGWAAVQILAGGTTTGRLDATLTSAALGALPAVDLRSGPALSRGGPAVVTSILAGLGICGYLETGVPPVSILLLTLAPWTPWVDRIAAIRKRSPWTRAAVRGLVVLGAVGAAVLVAESARGTPIPDDSTLGIATPGTSPGRSVASIFSTGSRD